MERFQPKQEITEATERLLNCLRELKRGDIITYEVMEKVIGLKRKNNRFKTVFNKARKQFLQDVAGIDLDPIRGVGYRLLTKHAQLFNIRRPKKEVSQRRKWSVELIGVTKETLTDGERQVVKDQYERNQAAIREEKNHIAFLKAMAGGNDGKMPSLLRPPE